MSLAMAWFPTTVPSTWNSASVPSTLHTPICSAPAEATKLDREELAVQLKGAVKEGYLSLTLVRQLKAVTVEHIAAVDKILESVRLRYEVGRGNQQDVLRAELELSRLDDRLIDI